MVDVRILTAVASPEGDAWHAGDIIDMEPEQADVWADGVRGELVRDEPPRTPEQRRATPSTTTRGSKPARGGVGATG